MADRTDETATQDLSGAERAAAIEAAEQAGGVVAGEVTKQASDRRSAGAADATGDSGTAPVEVPTPSGTAVVLEGDGLPSASGETIQVTRGGIGRATGQDVSVSMGGIGLARGDRVSV